MPDPKSSPVPADLAKMLEGNRVAVLHGPQASSIQGRRACANCYWNPSGQICQVDPLKTQAFLVPNGARIEMKCVDVPQRVPNEYLLSARLRKRGAATSSA